VKIAQLKSSRSLTFTLLDVLRSVMPICSAMPANWLLKISSITGSASVEIARDSRRPSSVSNSSPRASTSARQPASTIVVERSS
jgi:hypothetical protein